jgi:hypothetical protein
VNGSTPIVSQLFDTFLGTQEAISSVSLPDIFSSGGSKNVWIDKFGRAKRILGYSRQNATAVVTNTGGSPTKVRALFPYRRSTGGMVRQVIGLFDDEAEEVELWYSTDEGGTWIFIEDLGADAVGLIPDFAQFGEQLIITLLGLQPRSWDGTTLTIAGGTQSPTPTAAVGTTGVLSGHYKWKIISIGPNGTRRLASISSSDLNLQAQRGSLSWTADADTDVVGYEVYRTTATGEFFYFVTFLDARLTVTYIDNTSDDAIVESRIMEEHGDPPPYSEFAEAHSQRMWYLGTTEQPQRAYFSDPGLPDSVWAENFIEFKDAETQGDQITGAKGDFNGVMVVFQERSIWTVSGTGQVINNINDWTRTRTNAGAGTVHQRTIVKVPAGARYFDQTGSLIITEADMLAYLTPFGSIRMFNGDSDTVISYAMQTTLLTMTHEQRQRSFAVHDPVRAEVTWMFPQLGSGECDCAVTWNYRWGVWYDREWVLGCAMEMDSASSSSVMLAGSTDMDAAPGVIYKLWDGSTFDGTGFVAQWMSKIIYGVTPGPTPLRSQSAVSHRKRWRWADLLLGTEAFAELTCEWLGEDALETSPAVGSQSFDPSAGILETGPPAVRILTGDGTVITVSQSSIQARVKLFSEGAYLHGRGMRLRVFDSGDTGTGSWSLESLNLAYQVLEGLKRAPGI